MPDMNDVVKEFAEMIAEGARIREQRAQEERSRLYREEVKELFKDHSTQDLIQLWNEFEEHDHALEEVQGFCIYKIMVALDQRGEGDLCRY